MVETLRAFFPDWLDPHAELIASVGAALVIFVLGWIASKWARLIVVRGLRRQNADEALALFLSSIAQYAVLIATVVTSLIKVGVAATSLVAVLGTIGLAVGLALQGSLGHLASGVMILLNRPFTIGHWVDVGGQSGVVQEVGLFATTLRAFSGEMVVIPNSEITGSSIVNHTVSGEMRVSIEVGVAYGTDYAQAEAAILEAIDELDDVFPEPAPDVLFKGFGASSLDLVARFWCDPGNGVGLSHQGRIAIYRSLDRAGIEIPFDQIVVHRSEDT